MDHNPLCLGSLLPVRTEEASLTQTALPRFLYSVARSNLGRLRRPYKLNFCVTYLCQSRCLTCDIWKMRPKGELTLEEIQKFAKENDYFNWVQLTGGEPFIRKDIVEIAEAFAETSHPYILSMPSNSLCPPSQVIKSVERILELDIPRFALTLSLDGPKATHDKIRGVEGNFDRVMDLYGELKRLKERKGFMLVFGYTMSRYNEWMLSLTIREVRRIFSEVRADDFHINVAQNSPNYYANMGLDIRPDPKAAVSELVQHLMSKKAKGTFPFVENRYLHGLISFLQTGRSPMKSREMDVSCFMDSFGEVYPSIMSDVRIGNIRQHEYSLEKVLNRNPSIQHWTSCEAYQTVLGGLFI